MAYAFSIGVQFNAIPHPALKMDSSNWVIVPGDVEKSRARFVAALGPYGRKWSCQYTPSECEKSRHFGDGITLVNAVYPKEESTLDAWIERLGDAMPTGSAHEAKAWLMACAGVYAVAKDYEGPPPVPLMAVQRILEMRGWT